jgi:hypothetical protein
MQLTPEQSLSIQTFLCDSGFIQEAPSDSWSPHKLSGYKTYLESKNLQYTHDPEPHCLASLPQELQAYVSIPDSVKVSKENSEEDSLDSEDEDLNSDENANKEEIIATDADSQDPAPESDAPQSAAEIIPQEEPVAQENSPQENAPQEDAAAPSLTSEKISLESVDKTTSLKVDTKKLNAKK